MKLKNLLHLRYNDVYLIGNLNPLFFYRLSPMMMEFIQLCHKKDYNVAMEILQKKYPTQINQFEEKIVKLKDKLFDDNHTDIQIKKDILSQPISILTLNITRKCNLKCSYCFEDMDYRKKGNMTFEVAKRAIDLFFIQDAVNVEKKIIFSGGEPLINYKLIKEVVAYIKQIGIQVKYLIKTNGVLLNEEIMDFLIQNNFRFSISLDGSEKSHDTHRVFPSGKGSFKKVDQVIHRLIEKKYAHNVSISGTVTPDTIDYIEESYRHINSYTEIETYALKPVMTSSDKTNFTEANLTNLYIAGLKNNKVLVEKNTEKIKEGEFINICGIGIWNIAIDVDGIIYPCYRMCGLKKFIIGNIFSLQLPFILPKELVDIYKIEEDDECSKCYLIAICKSGCYAEKIMDVEKSKKKCPPVKKIFEDMCFHEYIKNGRYMSLETI